MRKRGRRSCAGASRAGASEPYRPGPRRAVPHRHERLVVGPARGRNVLAWWDADPVRELVDGTAIAKYGVSSDTTLLSASGVHSNNSTKSTPSLSGDILGDWREEVMWPTTNNTALRIYSSPYQTTRRIPTLLHDIQYREGLAWQNTARLRTP